MSSVLWLHTILMSTSFRIPRTNKTKTDTDRRRTENIWKEQVVSNVSKSFWFTFRDRAHEPSNLTNNDNYGPIVTAIKSQNILFNIEYYLKRWNNDGFLRRDEKNIKNFRVFRGISNGWLLMQLQTTSFFLHDCAEIKIILQTKQTSGMKNWKSRRIEETSKKLTHKVIKI